MSVADGRAIKCLQDGACGTQLLLTYYVHVGVFGSHFKIKIPPID
jgi:hypothetical protein